MKLIQAIVRPDKLGDVKDALTEVGVQGMTVIEVRGCGQQRGRREFYRGAEYVVELLPKTLLQVAVPEELAEPAVEAIANASRTGEIGDGKIFLLPLEEVIRVRTGERGKEAL
jgi:nitrogen regulatory protein P-II 1